MLIDIVNDLGLNGDVIVHEAELPSGQELLDQDFTLVRDLGARGFPTIIFVNEENKGVKITGGRSFEVYVEGLKQALNTEELEPKKRPAVSILLEKKSFYFLKKLK